MFARRLAPSFALLLVVAACAGDPTAPAAGAPTPRGGGPACGVVAAGAFGENFNFPEATDFSGVGAGAAGCGPATGWACVAPIPWRPNDFDVALHMRDRSAWDAPETFRAMHGTFCQPYDNLADVSRPNDDISHEARTFADLNYRCRNHMMTALKASGYGAAYVTPNAMVDFGTGEAVVRWAMSTMRTSGHDWIDLWVTPWDENLALPLDGALRTVDAQGPPKRAIHIRMTSDSRAVSAFQAFVVRNHVETALASSGEGYEALFPPVSTRRDTFELRISRTRVKFRMWKGDLDLTHPGAVPFAAKQWVDAELPATLDWTVGVVQFGHHSLDPAGFDGGFGGTWHWDDFRIAPAVPFTIVKARNPAPATPAHDRNAAEAHPVMVLASPTPTAGFLRFAGYGEKIEVSFDGDKSKKAELQTEKFDEADRFHSYWTPVPAGVTRITFSAKKDSNAKDQKTKDSGAWRVRDVAFWAR